MITSSVLFLCTGKSRRTQIAEGFPRAMAGDEFDVSSAASEEMPRGSDAIAAMREVGIDISGQQPKAVNSFLGGRFSYVITLCDRHKEKSDLEDPSRVPTPDDRREALRRVRDEIQQHLMDFVKKNGMTKGKVQRNAPRGEGAST